MVVTKKRATAEWIKLGLGLGLGLQQGSSEVRSNRPVKLVPNQRQLIPYILCVSPSRLRFREMRLFVLFFVPLRYIPILLVRWDDKQASKQVVYLR